MKVGQQETSFLSCSESITLVLMLVNFSPLPGLQEKTVM